MTLQGDEKLHEMTAAQATKVGEDSDQGREINRVVSLLGDQRFAHGAAAMAHEAFKFLGEPVENVAWGLSYDPAMTLVRRKMTDNAREMSYHDFFRCVVSDQFRFCQNVSAAISALELLMNEAQPRPDAS